VLLSHPDVDVVFALDSTGTLGAYLALKARNLTNHIKSLGCSRVLSSRMQSDYTRSIPSLLKIPIRWLSGGRVFGAWSSQNAGPGQACPMLITAENVDSAAAKPFITNDWRAEHQ